MFQFKVTGKNIKQVQARIEDHEKRGAKLISKIYEIDVENLRMFPRYHNAGFMAYMQKEGKDEDEKKKFAQKNKEYCT